MYFHFPFPIITFSFQQIAEDRSGGGGGGSASRGANGHGFYDYKRGKFVMADGRYDNHGGGDKYKYKWKY